MKHPAFIRVMLKPSFLEDNEKQMDNLQKAYDHFTDWKNRSHLIKFGNYLGNEWLSTIQNAPTDNLIRQLWVKMRPPMEETANPWDLKLLKPAELLTFYRNVRHHAKKEYQVEESLSQVLNKFNELLNLSQKVETAIYEFARQLPSGVEDFLTSVGY
ncbi:hypothetical protein SLEP1_g17586 [Rubroshorea leprosula]|uniref:Uncharacterized protein n=1 Tax=Rubroshorea leprosula TaxID=152421 RepID=A0AAV5J0L1_9ROSI|nr:hypothetical protein SLEP1_g17586 [Rubroshorea leprosula]